MNKQEAIKKIDRTLSLPRPIGSFPYDYEDGLRYAKHIINQIDVPEKPVIPQFVVEWIERSKAEKRNLRNALNNGGEKMRLWFLGQENYDIFARAWLDGYEVEKEKLYTARLKLITISCANYINKRSDGVIILSNLNTASGNYQTSFTRSELEQLNVWDNPAFEIDKVE